MAEASEKKTGPAKPPANPAAGAQSGAPSAAGPSSTPASPAPPPTAASPAAATAAAAASPPAGPSAAQTAAAAAVASPPPDTGGDGLLEADAPDDDDNDSALDVNSIGSDSASLASSILRYRIENGRTYHSFKAGSYILPNDEMENERLDLQHAMCVLTTDQQLYICPAGKNGHQIHRCLDAGCGTGIWAMDFADEHPEAQVIGVDLSPIQPSFVPPNVSFYVDDIEAEWTYSHPFDFVYMRMTSASIADWPKLFGQVYRNLTPGGWVELLDPIYPIDCDDGTLPKDSALYRWSEYMTEAAAKLGSPLDSGLAYKDQLIDAGFTNVVQTTYKWPTNPWPRDPKHKELGTWGLENLMQGLQGFSLALFTRALNWKAEDLELFLVEVRKDLRNRNMHAYFRIVVTYGQKPE